MKDSASGRVLPMATVSVYRSADSMFIVALFSGNNGSFSLRSLPVDSVITLSVSYVGYRRYVKKIRLPAEQPQLKLGDVLLSDDSRLQDVVVTAEMPPLRMKGDTLEINPAAFNAGPNAVMEDVLKKVPGVVIWGDNKITVNGKVVIKLLVDGKPFFGGSFTVATQNLPPEVVKKVQVYTTDKRRPDDKTMNLVLHDDQKNGRFGNVSVAAGSGRHYEGDVTWNMYKPKMQLSAGAVSNNTNKVAGNLSNLLQYNTYRGNITHPAYQSDFLVDGANKYQAGGIFFNKEVADNRSLQIEYFGNSHQKAVERKSTEVTFVGDSSLSANETGKYKMNSWQHEIKGEYTWIRHKGTDLKSDFAVLVARETFVDSVTGYMRGAGGMLLNRSSRYAGITRHRRSAELRTVFYNRPPGTRKASFEIDHTIKAGNGDRDRTLVNNYEIYNTGRDSTQIQYNRLFEEDDQVLYNKANIAYDINYLFNKLRGRLSNNKRIYTNIRLLNGISHRYSTVSAQVNDYDPATALYKTTNNYLTNTNRESLFEERPGLSFSLGKDVVFSGRYSKKANLSGKLEWQYQSLSNKSDKVFRNLHNRYTAVLPSVVFAYGYTRLQAFSRDWSFRYTTHARTPELNELAPLTDSTNLLFLTIGNPGLKLQYQHHFSFHYQYTNLKNNHIIGAELNSAAFTNRIMQNTFYNPDGRQVLSFINTDNYRNAFAVINYRLPVKLNKIVLNLEARGEMYMETGDLFVNYEKSTFQNRRANIQAIAKVVLGNTELSVNQRALWLHNRLRFSELQTSSGFNYFTSAMIQKRIDRLTLASYTQLDLYRATQVPFISRFIWNAAISYRMLKNEQIELKVSCNDILKQNQSVANTAYQNKVNQIEVNRLTRFVLLGVTYYPRKFGHIKQK
ncbi:hypothetical protein HNQ91_003733 [Filimonas zeae]|uniref:outer membrane beta-barrel protein n=1 Tax=Filimonas zeae TaxID=1737353 RepID=UPI00166CED25|nr:outer membrane beta-barrel protein [Filimonas zeae]MDR6340668.1 hypothetical protein [Filimonas zeae]